MSRSLIAVIFAIIVGVELYFYMSLDIEKLRIGPDGTKFTLIYGEKIYQAKSQQFLTLIGSTLVVGTVLTFALPKSKNKNNKLGQ